VEFNMTRRLRSLLFVTLACVLATSGTFRAQQLPQTWQEQQKFRSGPTPFEPLMQFWHELDAASEIVSLRPLTRTLLDREMPLIADPPITNPQDALRSGKTIVLLAPSVHGGEVSPKEAVQLIAKELVAGTLQPLLRDVIVLALPLVNPDGGEVRRRTNEAGYDMNSDYVKLESQEIHALVTQVMNEWTPDIHVDGHHGGSAPYVITYQLFGGVTQNGGHCQHAAAHLVVVAVGLDNVRVAVARHGTGLDAHGRHAAELRAARRAGLPAMGADPHHPATGRLPAAAFDGRGGA